MVLPVDILLIMTDIARNSLMSILIEMNGSLVNAINRLLTAGQVAFAASNYDTWNTIGTRNTNATVTTLAQLYQRQLQSGSILRKRIQENSEIVDLKYESGSSYKGQVKDGLPHGYGCWTGPSGEWYEGEYENGRRHGSGKNGWSNGDVYEGNWSNDQRHGYGKNTWPTGAKAATHVGYWKENKRYGYGVTTFLNGRRYEGHWKTHMAGEGIITAADGTKKHGKWDLDVLY